MVSADSTLQSVRFSSLNILRVKKALFLSYFRIFKSVFVNLLLPSKFIAQGWFFTRYQRFNSGTTAEDAENHG